MSETPSAADAGPAAAGKKDDHDQSKVVTVVVNGRKKEVKKPHLSFKEVVGLADNMPSGPNIIYTVTYNKGPRENPEGTMVEGDKVKIQDGMIFNVTSTDKS
jgi:hypothetical protein